MVSLVAQTVVFASLYLFLAMVSLVTHFSLLVSLLLAMVGLVTHLSLLVSLFLAMAGLVTHLRLLVIACFWLWWV